MPIWTRGRPRLIYEVDTGDLRCTACGACALACPVDVIKIEQHPNPVQGQDPRPLRHRHGRLHRVRAVRRGVSVPRHHHGAGLRDGRPRAHPRPGLRHVPPAHRGHARGRRRHGAHPGRQARPARRGRRGSRTTGARRRPTRGRRSRGAASGTGPPATASPTSAPTALGATAATTSDSTTGNQVAAPGATPAAAVASAAGDAAAAAAATARAAAPDHGQRADRLRPADDQRRGPQEAAAGRPRQGLQGAPPRVRLGRRLHPGNDRPGHD